MGKLKNRQIDLESQFVPSREDDDRAAIVRSLELYIHDITGLRVLLDNRATRESQLIALPLIDKLISEVQAVIDWAPNTLTKNREEN